MTIQELRQLVENRKKYPGTVKYPPASVCNNGFPGTFNLSFTEAEMLKLYGQYLDYNQNLIYSKIQPVIRFQDWQKIANQDESSYRYLSIFEMADVAGQVILTQPGLSETLSAYQIKEMYTFLIDELGLNSNQLRISYFSGENVRSATEGKYTFDFDIPADPSIKYWKELGLTDEQFIPNRTRDTLLALNIYGLPTPWGYRHEIHYLYNGNLLDIATMEYLIYRPTKENGEINGLKSFRHSLAVGAVGLERILMIKNGLTRATDCDHIQPLIRSILRKAEKQDYNQAEILCQALRATHKIISDSGGYKNLGNHRKEKFRDFCKAIVLCHIQLDIDLSYKQLEQWLNLNSALQDFCPELKPNAIRTAQEIIDISSRIKTVPHSVPMGV